MEENVLRRYTCVVYTVMCKMKDKLRASFVCSDNGVPYCSNNMVDSIVQYIPSKPCSCLIRWDINRPFRCKALVYDNWKKIYWLKCTVLILFIIVRILSSAQCRKTRTVSSKKKYDISKSWKIGVRVHIVSRNIGEQTIQYAFML